jgi:hypothetical protein
MTTQDVTRFPTTVPVAYYRWAPLAKDAATDERSAFVRATVAAGATDGEWAGFVEICNAFRLNPLQNPRPIWLIRYDRGEPMVPQIGIAGYRIFAARTGRYAGASQPEWAGQPRDPDAQIAWRSAWLFDDPPAVSRVGVWATTFRLPVWGIATWREFAKWTADQRTGQRRLRSLWATYPSLMLAKCAEKQALCKAFPEQLAEADALQLFAAEPAPPLRTAITEADLVRPQQHVQGADLPTIGPGQRADLAWDRLPAAVQARSDARYGVPSDTSLGELSAPDPLAASVGALDEEDRARRRFWARAQELGYLTPDGRLSKRRVHETLGLAPRDGALAEAIAAGDYTWELALVMLEDNAPAREDSLAPDALGTGPDATPMPQRDAALGRPHTDVLNDTRGRAER